MSPVEKDHTRGWNAAVAAEIRAERAALGITVDELAEDSGVPKRTLMRLINAQRAIDVAHLAAIAEALDISVQDLLDRAEVRRKRLDENDEEELLEESIENTGANRARLTLQGKGRDPEAGSGRSYPQPVKKAARRDDEGSDD